jgi:hypothetical protein
MALGRKWSGLLSWPSSTEARGHGGQARPCSGGLPAMSYDGEATERKEVDELHPFLGSATVDAHRKGMTAMMASSVDRSTV